MTEKTLKAERAHTKSQGEVSEGATEFKGEAFAVLLRDRPNWLDRPIDDLVKYTAVGAAFVSFHRTVLRRMTEVGIAEEYRLVRLAEVQTAAKVLLEAEARIGQLLPEPHEMHRLSGKGNVDVTRGARPARILPQGISRKRALQARLLASNPDALRRVVKAAIRDGDIPTKGAVIREIAREHKDALPIDSRDEDPKTELTPEQKAYIDALEQIVAVLPPKRPQGLNPRFTAMVLPLIKTIVFRRLDDWREDMGRYGNRAGASLLDEAWHRPRKSEKTGIYDNMSDREFLRRAERGG